MEMKVTTLFIEVEPSYTMDGAFVSKERLLLLDSPRWSKLISQSGTIFGGKVQWFILSNIEGGNLGFINVYAPCDPHLRRLRWETMTTEISNTCRWITLGDFNMVERRIDKSSSWGKILPTLEWLVFNTLKDSIQVSKSPLTFPSMTYSWDNLRGDGSWVLAQLDRCYIILDSTISSWKILG